MSLKIFRVRGMGEAQDLMVRDALGKIVSGMLESPEFQTRWREYFYTRRDEHPAAGMNAQDPQWREYSTAFMRALLALEQGALEKTWGHKTAKHGALQADLAALIRHLDTVLDNESARGDLPAPAREALDIIERYTLQKPFCPAQIIKDFTRETCAHIKTEATTHPAAFGVLLTTSLALLTFMNMKIGAQTQYIDPALIGLTDASFDAAGNVVNFTPPDIDYGAALSCHDHIAQLSPDLAQILAKYDMTLPQHCARLKTMALDAQSDLQAGYDLLKTPFNALVKDPVQGLGQALFEQSHFMAAFNATAQNVSEFVYQANIVENIVVHSLILGAAFWGTVKCGNLDPQARQEITGHAWNFLHRSFVHRPLAYVFCAAAGGGASMAHTAGLGAETLWAGLAGGVAGYLVHDIHRRFERKEHAQKILSGVQKDIASLNAYLGPSSVSKVPPFGDEKPKVRRLAALFAFSAYGGLALADMAGYLDQVDSGLVHDLLVQGSEVAGSLTATALILGAYVPFNVAEDALQHVFFGLAGLISALPVIPVARMARHFQRNNEPSASVK